MRMFVILLIISIPSIVLADPVIDFVIDNNPELQEIHTINKNIMSQLKIEAKGAATYGQLLREGTYSLEESKTRYDIGIAASIPLISPSEKAQRRIEEARLEKSIRLAVADYLRNYREDLKSIEGDEALLKILNNELQWINKRVEVGIDSQKEYNQKLEEYTRKKKELEVKKEHAKFMLEMILSFVSKDKRERLKELLDAKR
jgi:hypothetical protein